MAKFPLLNLPTAVQYLWAQSMAVWTPERLLQSEAQRCGGSFIDPHLHIAPWFTPPAAGDDDFQPHEIVTEELASANISIGMLYNPYPSQSYHDFDLNTFTQSVAEQSHGHIYALSSFNATHDDWDAHREEEMERLSNFLDKPSVLGAKLAPPNTCLSLTSSAIGDMFEVLSKAGKANVLGIHIGTTPFCGPLGAMFGIQACCEEDYVRPKLLTKYLDQYPNVTVVLLHAGHEFLPPDSPYFYNFTLVDDAIELATTYPNVYLSMSAWFAVEPADKKKKKEGSSTMTNHLKLKYPGGYQSLLKMKHANVLHKLMWGSDTSYQRGSIRKTLMRSIQAMIRARMTPTERCWALRGAATEAFRIPTIISVAAA